MTSKQALEELAKELSDEYGIDMAYYPETFEKFRTIGKDLKVLEIIKKKVLSIDMFYQNAQTLTTEELNLIKEWLQRN